MCPARAVMLWLLWSAMPVACVAGVEFAPADTSPACSAPRFVRDPAMDRYARMLAGMPVAGVGPAITTHARQMDGSFVRLEKVQLGRIRRWSATVLPPDVSGAEVLFYPFSGPDVLYPTALFPHARKLLFTGLETVGAPPTAEDFGSADLPDSFAELRRSLVSLLGQSFFVTAQMQQQFHRNRFRGATPILLLLLARAGHRIDSVAALRLDDDGRLCAREFAERRDAAGIGIRFRAAGESALRSLVYLRADLSDRGLAGTPGYARLVRGLGVRVSFLKSASYLLHTREFSDIRELLLEVSPALLQDDSGIPWRSFPSTLWASTVYGAYRRGGGGFENQVQADLRDAYLAAPARPLPFWIGYRRSATDSNLQLYRRRAPLPESALKYFHTQGRRTSRTIAPSRCRSRCGHESCVCAFNPPSAPASPRSR
ncbi:MAG: hypothetical protein OMOMHJEC_02060 [Xanthomonadales bacterium]|nr:hypothetical protein [Xanthomonadales bacterium]